MSGKHVDLMLRAIIRVTSVAMWHLIYHAHACSRGLLGALQAKAIGLIRHTILEEIAITDERIAWITIWSIKHAILPIHLRCVQALQSRDCIVDLADINALKVIAASDRNVL